MPDANPGAKTIAFPAVYDGVQVHMTAVAHGDQIDLYPVASKRLEIERDVFAQIAMFLTIAAHSQPSPPTGGKDHLGPTG